MNTESTNPESPIADPMNTEPRDTKPMNADSQNAEGNHVGPPNASDASPTKLGRLLHGARAAIDDGLFGPPLFWTWNAVFIAFTLLGFAPVVLVDMLRAARVADVATPMAVWGLALVLIPVLSVGIALRFLRHRPQALYAFFYGVEAPLMLIAAVRLFVLRDLPAHAAMLYTAALIGLAALAFEILFGRKASAPRAVLAARVAGLTVLTITGIYVAAWVAFLAAPVAWMYLDFVGEALEGIAYAFRRGSWSSLAEAPFGQLFFALLGAPLLIFTASLFIASPVLVPALYVRRWRHAVRSLAARTSRTMPAGIAVAVAVVWIGLFTIAARQPQHAAFAMLEGVEAEGPASVDERQALALKEARIKSGLLNAYLARYRYAGVSGVYRQIEHMYSSTFGRERDYTSVMTAYDRIARPFLYEPVNPVTGKSRAEEDPARAAQLYAAFYDDDIARAERGAVQDAVRYTWQPDQAAASLSDIEARNVRLESQALSVETAGDIATFELHEVYRNQTFMDTEVFYYLTLPESAVVTGLWLGTSPDKERADSFRVSTRGAAQAVYLQQRRIQVDPALMEQIGPRQYRLRIFPILARQREFRSDGEIVPAPDEGKPLHLWLRVQVMASDDGFPLPTLSERRNVYWDGRTERVITGVGGDGVGDGSSAAEGWADDEWLPRAIGSADAVTREVHRADFEGGMSVVAQPAGGDAGDGAAGPAIAMPGDGRIAIVLDRSRSMGDLENALLEVLDELRTLSADFPPGVEVDVVLTSSPVRGEPARLAPFESMSDEDLTFFGGMTPAELLGQFDELRQGREYDAILVLTDAGGFTPQADVPALPNLGAPLWMVHVGGDIPPGYPDAMLDAMRSSGGGATGRVTEALARSFGAGGELVEGELVDGYRWHVVDPSTADGLAPNPAADPAFEPLAARMLILHAERSARADLAASDESARLAGLDALHGLAVEHGIVTPYSSMIVLVNAQQHADLDRLEEAEDRFAREVEDEGPESRELALAPVTAVPEPAEWLLLALAAAAVAVMARRRWVGEAVQA